MKKMTTLICICMACMFLLLTPGLTAHAAEETDCTSVSLEEADEPQPPASVNITVVLPETEKTTEGPALDEPEAIKLFPADVTEIREGGGWQIIKTYELREDESPMDIPQGSFERSGWCFTLTDIIRKETANVETREVSKTIEIATETKEIEQILPLLAPTIEYRDDDGFVGILTLDVSSIKVETAGTRTSSYTMNVTRQYPHLSSNDTSLLPKTVEDRGKTYTLASVDWQAQSTESIDYTDLPTSYTAVATYTATGTSTRVTGYTTTAVYSGTLANLSQGRTLYIAHFQGEEIETPPKMATPELPPVPSESPAEEPGVADAAAQVTNQSKEPADDPATSPKAKHQQDDGDTRKTSAWLLIIPCVAVAAIVVVLTIRKKGAKATRNPAAMLLTLILAASMAAPALAADYNFESGGDTWGNFGNATTYEANPVPDPMNENRRRNKDAALSPPPFGVFSGEIPTNPTSPYHNNLIEGGFIYVNQDLPPVGNENYAPGISNTDAGLLPSTSQTAALNTVPWHYEDGTIGTLYISKLDKTIKVYEGESLENMKKGIGHFTSTSAWDGNVGFAGHNRGAAAYFGFVKELKIGDRLTYTTRYGTRTYEVFLKEQISETDFSTLRWTQENTLTLITCVENVPELRWCVQAREVR